MNAAMKILRTEAELVEAYRARIRELGITYETVDAISGLPSGYTAKLMAPEPIKGIGPIAREGLNGALAVALTFTVDQEQVERVRARWVPRRRAHDKKKVASLVCAKRQEISEKSKQQDGFASMQILGRAGGMASGKKRRAKAMRRRELQRKRSHAARARWAKRATAAAIPV